MSQAEVGDKLATSQSAVAKLETRDDVLISTFARYVEAVGARYTIEASFVYGPSRL